MDLTSFVDAFRRRQQRLLCVRCTLQEAATIVMNQQTAYPPCHERLMIFMFFTVNYDRSWHGICHEEIRSRYTSHTATIAIIKGISLCSHFSHLFLMAG